MNIVKKRKLKCIKFVINKYTKLEKFIKFQVYLIDLLLKLRYSKIPHQLKDY